MRNILLLIGCLTCSLSEAQQLHFSGDFDKTDVQDAFRLLGLSHFTYRMPDDLKGCYFDLVIREYYEGKEVSVQKQASLFTKMKQVLQWKSSQPAYTLKIQTAKMNDSTETYTARMPGIGLRGRTLALKLSRSQYAWETLVYDSADITTDKEIPILTFASNPQNSARPNTAVYCELSKSSNGEGYRAWFEQFKVRHCYVFLIKAVRG